MPAAETTEYSASKKRVVCLSCARYAATSFSAISSNVILLFGSMNDGNETKDLGERLRATRSKKHGICSA